MSADRTLYDKTVWQNDVTALNATNLNKIEAGIYKAMVLARENALTLDEVYASIITLSAVSYDSNNKSYVLTLGDANSENASYTPLYHKSLNFNIGLHFYDKEEITDLLEDQVSTITITQATTVKNVFDLIGGAYKVFNYILENEIYSAIFIEGETENKYIIKTWHNSGSAHTAELSIGSTLFNSLIFVTDIITTPFLVLQNGTIIDEGFDFSQPNFVIYYNGKCYIKSDEDSSTFTFSCPNVEISNNITYYQILKYILTINKLTKVWSATTKSIAVYEKSQIDSLLATKQNSLTFDNTPTENSSNLVKSGGIYTAIKNAISNAYIYKGTKTVAEINTINTSTLSAGFVYNISDSGTITLGSKQVIAGDNIAWTGTDWDRLAGFVNISVKQDNLGLTNISGLICHHYEEE